MNTRYKYPSIPYLPYSESIGRDDDLHSYMRFFDGKYVVVTEKMDGENTTMYFDHIHARSIDSQGHESRDWVKSFHSKIKGDIHNGWRICGENLYAKHSILYKDLPSYFLGFAVFDADNVCLNTGATRKIFTALGIHPVPEIYFGVYNKDVIQRCFKCYKVGRECEGYVIRNVDDFHYDDLGLNTAKYVRANHVQTNDHWMYSKVVKNKLRSSSYV